MATKRSRKRKGGFIGTTLVGGVLFLVPVVMATFFLGKALKLMEKLAAPIAKHVPVESLAGVAVLDLVAIAVLVVICFLAGLVARSEAARRLMNAFEAKVLWKVPGYTFVKAVTASFSDEDDDAAQVVLCRFDDLMQVGFEIERLPDGRVVVYVPAVPVPWSGSVIVMDPERVQVLDAKFVAVMRSLRRFGIGTADLLTGSQGAAKPATR
jgi:uncharacterized membrane protein